MRCPVSASSAAKITRFAVESQHSPPLSASAEVGVPCTLPPLCLLSVRSGRGRVGLPAASPRRSTSPAHASRAYTTRNAACAGASGQASLGGIAAPPAITPIDHLTAVGGGSRPCCGAISRRRLTAWRNAIHPNATHSRSWTLARRHAVDVSSVALCEQRSCCRGASKRNSH